MGNTKKRIILYSMAVLCMIAILLFRCSKAGILPNKVHLALLIGTHSSVSEALSIQINPPEELDFKSRSEIYAMRRGAVAPYSHLTKANYQPSNAVFGQIEDGKPWWGLKGSCFYGSGKNSIEGLSEESRFILNPFILVGITDKYARTVRGRRLDRNAIYPKPVSLIWQPQDALATVRYNVQQYWREYIAYTGEVLFELECFTLVLYNARDLGLNYMYIDTSKSVNLVPDRLDDKLAPIRQFIHCGDSCGYPGGANNMSPYDPAYEIKLLNTPAKAYIKLWSDRPDNRDIRADMVFIIELI